MERSDVPAPFVQRLHERIYRVDTREHDPIVGVRCRCCLQQRSAVFRRRDSDHRCLDGVGAKRGKTIDEVSGLLARPSDEHAAPEKRAGIEPAQVLSKSDHASNDQRCRLAPRVLTESIQQLRNSSGYRLLVGQCAVVDEDALGVGSPAVVAQRLQDVCQLLGACVAHDGAVKAGETRPIDIGHRAVVVFVPSKERDSVAGAGIAEGHAGVRGCTLTAAGTPGTTSNGTPCSCRNSASSAPRANTNESPHFSRATRLPSRAFSASR